MLPARELARQQGFKEGALLVESSRSIGDFAWRVMTRVGRYRGEEREGFAMGVINALETLALQENE